ncbi:hypothetical protein [Devosia sp.]|uniref:hypothetical protein n=1 Tax=Devosia sp. TaxID=1871048 RepID=UPI0027355C1D|nr:hypothetical protein [Devosia sp.]MDP2779759.1 hypothetical protein [Devosia sp.]
MNFYIAAKYIRRLEMQGYARELEAVGHYVTSRWLSGSHDGLGDGSDSVAARAVWAEEDVDDLCAAGAIICFTEPAISMVGRGGRHIELGIAMGMNIIRRHLHMRTMRLIVVGPRESVFHCRPELDVFPTWAECLAALSMEPVRL